MNGRPTTRGFRVAIIILIGGSKVNSAVVLAVGGSDIPPGGPPSPSPIIPFFSDSPSAAWRGPIQVLRFEESWDQVANRGLFLRQTYGRAV